MECIRILLADGYAGIAEAVAIALNRQAEFTVLGRAASIHDAIGQLSRKRPDLLLFDPASFPTDTATSSIEAICHQFPRTRLLLINWSPTDAQLIRAIEAGAWGLVSRNSGLNTLFRAIRAVHSGELWMPRSALNRLVVDRRSRWRANGRALNSLSAREEQICRHVARGESNKEIARQLSITEGTVKSHLNHIFHKLKLTRRVELAAIRYPIQGS